MSDTAEAQLGRIYYIVAAAQLEGGILVDDLAARLGVDAETVRADIREVENRDYYPRESIPEFRILLEDDRVTVDPPGAFRRPLRLLSHEAGALGLALRARAAEAAAEYRDELLALARNLEEALTSSATTTPEASSCGKAAGSAEPAAPRLATSLDVDPGEGADAGVRLRLEQAIATRAPTLIRYLKPGQPEPTERTIYPYALVSSDGAWYVIAHSPQQHAMRIFRLDRVLVAAVQDGSFEVPADFAPAKYVPGGRPFVGGREVEVTVRYSARVAPWVLERGAGEPGPDGSVLVRYLVSDVHWLVREILRSGGEAEVLEPQEMR